MSKCFRIEQIRENINIEKRIKMDKQYKKGEVIVLLLGTNQSGKSTLIRQLKIVHGVGFSEDEKRNFIVPIHQQMVKTIQDLIFEMNLLKKDYENLENKENARKLMRKEYSNVRAFTEGDTHTLRRLWSEPGLKQCCDKGNEHQLSDSQRYFLHHIDRVTESNYLPSVQDILYSTGNFNGIADYLYPIGDLPLRIIDIRGLRTERRKWIHYFESIQVLMFILAFSDYDQIEINDTKFINDKWFRNCGILLLLNKKDILEEKILVSKLVDYFPEFGGPRKDAQAAIQFILQMFLEVNADPNRIIYEHFTCLSDKENVRYISAVVTDVILERNIKTYQGKSCCCF